MFTRDTVLVLGAGSNLSYGFPSGNALLDWMLNDHSEALTNNLRSAAFDDSALTEFRKVLLQACPPSIDQFLEWHHPTFTELGKFLIAHCIMQRETDIQGLMTYSQGDCWYRLLLHEVAPDLASISKNRLTIVTFNYDRSLEHYLFTAIENRFALDDRQAAEALQGIRFIHVHGTLGLLPWQAGPGRTLSGIWRGPYRWAG